MSDYRRDSALAIEGPYLTEPLSDADPEMLDRLARQWRATTGPAAGQIGYRVPDRDFTRWARLMTRPLRLGTHEWIDRGRRDGMFEAVGGLDPFEGARFQSETEEPPTEEVGTNLASISQEEEG